MVMLNLWETDMKATFRVELENLTSKQSTKNGILVFDKDDMIVSRDVVLSLLICMYGETIQIGGGDMICM